ncbi:MAG: MltA domain-containing protein [Rickettsiales bacterium]|jgi:membrane-bound lytic murein transglycosylase A|nr:MltA domain-containing protein [Rickettsiales bacterium]
MAERQSKLLGVACVLLALASCRSSRLDDRIPFRKSEKKMNLSRTDFAILPGWQNDDPSDALSAFKKSCVRIMSEGDFVASSQIVISADFMKSACAAAPSEETPGAARAYFEFWFDPYMVSTIDGRMTGTVTSYYESELEGDVEPSCDYLTPIYGKPSDLNGGKYFTRKQIENGAIRDRAPVLFWAKNPSDVHILHIQGSGIVRSPKGRAYRIGYAGNNGYSFSGIGSILQRHGIRPGKGYSMIGVKEWLDENPERARALMQENQRFIFFRDIVGDGPVGAMGVPLTPGRSIAVDPEYIPLGLPLFLAAKDPDGEKIERLVVAQDTGSAIKGVIRADYFWGSGNQAFDKAGRMNSEGSYYILLPKEGKNFAVKK